MQKVINTPSSGIPSIGLDRAEECEEEAETARKIGGISLMEEIGRGAFAIVYKGRLLHRTKIGKEESGRTVAVKEIGRNKLNEKLMQSLKKETSITLSLESEYIVRLHKVMRTSKSFYLIMEYCNGGDLNKLLKKHHRFEEHIVQRIIYQVSQGLKVLRSFRIVHRDLKLSNFLLTLENGVYKVKIADFGFATVLDSGQEAETFCGTAPNMAPEVLAGYFSSKFNVG